MANVIIAAFPEKNNPLFGTAENSFPYPEPRLPAKSGRRPPPPAGGANPRPRSGGAPPPPGGENGRRPFRRLRRRASGPHPPPPVPSSGSLSSLRASLPLLLVSPAKTAHPGRRPPAAQRRANGLRPFRRRRAPPGLRPSLPTGGHLPTASPAPTIQWTAGAVSFIFVSLLRCRLPYSSAPRSAGRCGPAAPPHGK